MAIIGERIGKSIRQIIDTHCYLGTNPFTHKRFMPEDYNELRLKLEKKGMDVAFIPMSYDYGTNKNLDHYVKACPGLFAGAILQFNPNAEGELAQQGMYMEPAELEEVIERGNNGNGNNGNRRAIVGLKDNTAFTAMRIDHDGMRPFVELAVKHRLPMVIHCPHEMQEYVSPAMVPSLLSSAPELKIVLAHFGGLNEGYVALTEELLSDFPDNLYVNTAGLSGEIARYASLRPLKIHRENDPDRWAGILAQAAGKRAFKGRILFGTDIPELEWSVNPIDYLAPETVQEIVYDTPHNVFLTSSQPPA